MSELEPRFVISPEVRKKLLEKHDVEEYEVWESFADRGKPLMDVRERHKTDPPTLWVVGSTNSGRLLKVVYMLLNNKVIIKSAFPANDDEIRIYNKYGR